MQILKDLSLKKLNQFKTDVTGKIDLDPGGATNFII